MKWHFCLFSTSELNDDKWYLYLCISLGFCFGVALIFWKLWTTKHVRVILLWTMMLAAVMLLLRSFAKKNTWIFTGCCCCSLSENLDWILVNICDFTHCCSWSHHVGDFNWWGMCFWRFQFWKYHFYVCSDLQITFIHMFRLADHCYLFHILAICISLVMTISFILSIRFCMCYFVSINWQTYRRCAALSFMPHRLPQRVVPGSTNSSAIVL